MTKMHAIEEKWQGYKKQHGFESIKYKEYHFFLIVWFSLLASVTGKSERLSKDQEKKRSSSSPLPLLSLEKDPKRKKNVTLAVSTTV